MRNRMTRLMGRPNADQMSLSPPGTRPPAEAGPSKPPLPHQTTCHLRTQARADDPRQYPTTRRQLAPGLGFPFIAISACHNLPSQILADGLGLTPGVKIETEASAQTVR